MPASVRRLTADDLGSVDFVSEFAYDVLNGLSTMPKHLSSKYFYDDKGSELFTKITGAPEYYLTGVEREILVASKGSVAEAIGDQPFNLVELGAGDGQKTNVLLAEFLERGLDFKFAPVDISKAAVDGFCADCEATFPTLEVEGLVAEYATALRWLSSNQTAKRRNVVLFLGSSIGNFPHKDAHLFFTKIWNSLNHGDLFLCGFDLKKDIPTMVAAYNDAAGVTRDFNLNVLTRINRELDANFDLDKWMHYEPYDAEMGAMRSFLVSKEQQDVHIGSVRRTFSFDAWESIYMECSVKFTDRQIRKHATDAGFVVLDQYADPKQYYVNSLWEVQKEQ